MIEVHDFTRYGHRHDPVESRTEETQETRGPVGMDVILARNLMVWLSAAISVAVLYVVIRAIA